MNYQQLQDILRQNRQGGWMQPSKALSLNDVISGIQSQYTQPQSSFGQSIPAMVQSMQAQQPSGAARFANGPQSFTQQEFTPASQGVRTEYTPGTFNIDDYIASKLIPTGENQGSSSMVNGESGSISSPGGSMESWGSPVSGATIGKGLLGLATNNVPAVINALINGYQSSQNATYGTTATNPDGSKTISGYINGQQFGYTEAPDGSISSDPMGYGVSSTSVGAPASMQAAEQAQAFAESLGGSIGSNGGFGAGDSFGNADLGGFL